MLKYQLRQTNGVYVLIEMNTTIGSIEAKFTTNDLGDLEDMLGKYKTESIEFGLSIPPSIQKYLRSKVLK